MKQLIRIGTVFCMTLGLVSILGCPFNGAGGTTFDSTPFVPQYIPDRIVAPIPSEQTPRTISRGSFTGTLLPGNSPQNTFTGGFLSSYNLICVAAYYACVADASVDLVPVGQTLPVTFVFNESVLDAAKAMVDEDKWDDNATRQLPPLNSASYYSVHHLEATTEFAYRFEIRVDDIAAGDPITIQTVSWNSDKTIIDFVLIRTVVGAEDQPNSRLHVRYDSVSKVSDFFYTSPVTFGEYWSNYRIRADVEGVLMRSQIYRPALIAGFEPTMELGYLWIDATTSTGYVISDGSIHRGSEPRNIENTIRWFEYWDPVSLTWITDGDTRPVGLDAPDGLYAKSLEAAAEAFSQGAFDADTEGVSTSTGRFLRLNIAGLLENATSIAFNASIPEATKLSVNATDVNCLVDSINDIWVVNGKKVEPFTYDGVSFFQGNSISGTYLGIGNSVLAGTLDLLVTNASRLPASGTSAIYLLKGIGATSLIVEKILTTE